MTDRKMPLQPGPVFYEVFLGVLRIFGTNLKDWSSTQGVEANNAKMAATGSWNGPKVRWPSADCLTCRQSVSRAQLLVDQGIQDPLAVLAAKDALELFQAEAEATATSMGLLPEQARALAVALDEMGVASGIRQIRDEASDALQLIQQWYPAGAALPPELATAASYLDEIVRKSAETTAELEGASSAAYSLSSAPIAAAISAALGPASRLNATLQSAAGWFDGIRTMAVVANYNRDTLAGSKTYSGRGGDPRDFEAGGSKSGKPFVYDGPALDRFNNPVITGGGRGGGGAAKAEKDAVAELIAKLREEQDQSRE